ncbi:MAG: thiamine-phosphate diphosphorylase [Methanosphaera sp. rholeuAM270]|nr:MAG: thiamine-phosphate diphosphorylase [Methanosphaera sp. rholeuAM270]
MEMKEYALYLVTDRLNLTEDQFLHTIEQAILGGTSIVQLREKTGTTKDYLDLARKTKMITDSYDVPLIINDRIDVALAVDAAGVHLGQDDMPCKMARKILGPDKTIGISATTYHEALKAQHDGADYIGVGAIVATPTKKDAKISTHDDLMKIKAKIEIPTVAIGGIDKNNAHKIVAEYGFDSVAVVSAIMKSNNPRKASIKLLNEINRQ